MIEKIESAKSTDIQKKEAVIIPQPIRPTMEEKKVTKPARKAVTK